MLDIMLDKDGDIMISSTGDISLTESVRQAILIRLRWIFAEWRLGSEYGFPWFEIMQVNNVKDADISDVVFDRAKRAASIRYTCKVGEEIFEDEVVLNE